MPFYRLHIKLDGQDVREFTIEDPRRDIELVYLDYKKRVNSKNGAGRVIYFDLVMIAEASLAYQDDREEVFNPENHFGLNLDQHELNVNKEAESKRKKQRKTYMSGPSLGERIKK
ncbi:MAG: hypothetical protein ABIN48_04210 [Ginsengibacter sp.]